MSSRISVLRGAAVLGAGVLTAGLFVCARQFDPVGSYRVVFIKSEGAIRLSFPSVWVLWGLASVWLVMSPAIFGYQVALGKRFFDALLRLRKLASFALGYYVAQVLSVFSGNWWAYISEKPYMEALYASSLILALLSVSLVLLVSILMGAYVAVRLWANSERRLIAPDKYEGIDAPQCRAWQHVSDGVKLLLLGLMLGFAAGNCEPRILFPLQRVHCIPSWLDFLTGGFLAGILIYSLSRDFLSAFIRWWLWGLLTLLVLEACVFGAFVFITHSDTDTRRQAMLLVVSTVVALVASVVPCADSGAPCKGEALQR